MTDSSVTRIHEGARIPDVFPVEMNWLCALLAEAETLGGYRAIQVRENEAGRVEYLAMQVVSFETRKRLWEARIRGELEGKKE